MIANIIRRVRKNHALEHGAVTVMLEKGARPPLGGYSTPGGFFIFGRASRDLVSQAVIQAYTRMVAGQEDLAVSPHCGTNLATGVLLGTFLFNRIMGKGNSRVRRLPLALAAFAGAIAVSRPLGNMLQRHFTTLADVGDGEIVNIKSFDIGSFTIHRITTRYEE